MLGASVPHLSMSIIIAKHFFLIVFNWYQLHVLPFKNQRSGDLAGSEVKAMKPHILVDKLVDFNDVICWLIQTIVLNRFSRIMPKISY